MKGIRRTPFWSVFRKEFLHLWRDRPSLAMAAGIPLMMLFLFGYGVNPDVRRLPTVVWDQCRSAESRELLQAFVNTTYFELKESAGGYGDIGQSLAAGRSRVALIIPPDFAANLQAGRLATIQVLLDGTEPQSTRQALQVAQSLVQAHGAQMLRQKEGALQQSFPLEARIGIWYNRELKTHFFTIPALIGLIMQNVTMTLTAFALVREKERGTMEQLIVTPVRPAELILGKLCPYVIVGMISFTLVLSAGSAWFSVPVRGSLPLLFGLAFLFVLTSLSIGMLMSTFSDNQLQAMQMAFAFILPSILLSGFVFPRETMPTPIRILGNFIPLTDFLVILRGIFLKEIGMGELYREVLSLAAFTVFLFVVALRRFRKRLD
ncbi:abc transporter [Heliomicrobium modesticaldum Ice1]|uniref:Abc transporter n=1 Tax=Heliobacterium modesticaldum (strain ATCC 51547 / Ice1) TaxID=498761 RepID=B0TEZ1_HELMI|nr:ABC transporter permease [Heliomicrobium modesticaldum]ABZ82974.1 abc transporter [Heliomicrobium modesticaldum Ice1]